MPNKPHRSGYKPNLPEDVLTRYNESLGGCHLYTGALDRHGYGQFCYSGYNGHRAHVVAWLVTNGDIPAGLVIDHMCGMKNCINVEHMQLLTAEENAQDGRDRKARPIECRRGHRGEYKKSKKGRMYCMACDREAHRK